MGCAEIQPSSRPPSVRYSGTEESLTQAASVSKEATESAAMAAETIENAASGPAPLESGEEGASRVISGEATDVTTDEEPVDDTRTAPTLNSDAQAHEKPTEQNTEQSTDPLPEQTNTAHDQKEVVPVSKCEIVKPSRCPNHMASNWTKAEDNHQDAAIDQSRCLKRAKDFYLWCGYKDDEIVLARTPDLSEAADSKVNASSFLYMRAVQQDPPLTFAPGSYQETSTGIKFRHAKLATRSDPSDPMAS